MEELGNSSQMLSSLPKSALQISFDLKICTTCKKSLDYNEMILCKECRLILCLNCFNHHCLDQSVWHQSCNIVSDCKIVCNRHGNKVEYLCKQFLCDIPICHNCAISKHRDHQILDIIVGALQLLEKVLQMYKLDKSMIQNAVENFKRRTDIHGKTNFFLRSLFKTRHAFVLKFIDTNFALQRTIIMQRYLEVENELVEEQSLLEKLLSLLKDKKKYSSFTTAEFSLEILKDFQKINAAFKIANDLKFIKQDYPKIMVKPTNYFKKNAESLLEFLIGDFKSSLDLNFFMEEKTPVPSILVFENKNSPVRDICYDSESKVLYILRAEHYTTVIVKLHDNGKREDFEIVSNMIVSTVIRMVPFGKEILLYSPTILLKTEGIKNCNKFSFPFCSPNMINSMCLSTCTRYIFIHCGKSGNANVYKYDTITNHYEWSEANLPKMYTTMRVSEDQDLIAFSGNSVGEAYIFSFNQKSFLLKFFANSSHHNFTTFFSNDILISYDKQNALLRWINIRTMQPIKRIQHRCYVDEHVSHIVATSSVMYLSVQVCPNTHKIYKLNAKP